MGDKSCLAVTFRAAQARYIAAVPAPIVVNPCLMCRGHSGRRLREGAGGDRGLVIHGDQRNCGIPATLGQTLRSKALNVWRDPEGLGYWDSLSQAGAAQGGRRSSAL